MKSIRMNRKIVAKSSFEEADNHVAFYENKTPLERLNYASDIINSVYGTKSTDKVDRTVVTSRKHAKSI
jgi:hypothetical protein